MARAHAAPVFQQRPAPAGGCARFHAELLRFAIVLGIVAAASAPEVVAQVRAPFKRISASSEVPAILTYGGSVAYLGDPDANGAKELLVGVPSERRVYVWSVEGLGRVVDWTFRETSEANTRFGESLTIIGDLNKDDLTDVAVGGVPRGTPSRTAGSVWILFGKRTSPYVEIVVQIKNDAGGLPFVLPDSSWFGAGVTGLGDLDGDNTVDIGVGAPGRASGQTGNVYILFMNADGTVREANEKGVVSGSLAGELEAGSRFGESVACIGDLNGDGVTAIAVGAPSAGEAGRVFILFLTSDGSVMGWTPIDQHTPALRDVLVAGDGFGTSVADAGDADGDGIADLLVGGIHHEGGRGALWRLFLTSDGGVKGIQEISNSGDGATDQLREGDQFGASAVRLGDVDDDGYEDMAVGSVGNNLGSIWLFFGLPLPLESAANLKVSPLLPSKGQEVVVKAHWGTGVAQATLSFREGGEHEFSETSLQRQGPTYRGTIPSFSIGHRGFEYFMTVTNVDGSEGRVPTEGSFSAPVYLPDGLKHDVQGSERQESYRLVSIPMELDVSDAAMVLERTFGSYDRTRWRLFSQDQTSGVFVEPDARTVDFAPGRAVWFLSHDGGQILTGPGSVIATLPPFKIPLQPGRWNLVGNPYNFSVPMAALRQQSGRDVDIETYTGDWTQPDSLRAFEGYVVFGHHPQRDTLIIDGSAKIVDAPPPSAQVAEWLITIKAQRGPARDDQNVAVVIRGADLGLDRYDRPEPPALGNFLSVHFECEHWGRGARGCRTDARDPVEPGHVWMLHLRSSEPGIVDLSFGALETVPSDHEVLLVDDELRVRRDLRMEPFLSRPVQGSPIASVLRLVVGPPDFVESVADLLEAQSSAQILDVYPNPVSSVASIRYVLKGHQKVSLHIYDLLGRRVTTLLEGQLKDEGPNIAVWNGVSSDGLKMSSGLYFVTLEESGSRVAVRAVVVGRGQ